MTGAASYDELPYGSRVVRETAPSHLAAVARLFGVPAPDPRTARVLELGCAEGGNLLAMAVAAPDARFVGVDLSERQVAAAEARRAALGLGNAVFHAADVAALDPAALGTFDYVVAHGLFSWVPEEVAEALLALAGRVLSESGVAYVSYNTYPGWHLRGLVRDLLRRATGGGGPAERLGRARELLGFAAANARDRSPAYGEVLRSALDHFSRHDDARLFHEWLEEWNRPAWFLDFVGASARHGLAPLADAHLAAMPMGRVKPDVDDLLSTRASGRLEKEELFDVLRNRSFRQTLLVRAPGPGREEPDPAALDGLLFATDLVPTDGPGEAASFRGPAGRLSTNDPALAAALRALHGATPRALPFEDLAPRSGAGLRPALLRCVASGLVDARATGVPCAEAPGERPVGSPLARLDAAEGPLVSSLAHRIVELDPASRLLLAELDGRDRGAVGASLARRLVAEGVAAGPDGTPLPEDEVQASVSGFLDEAIVSLARLALLVA